VRESDTRVRFGNAKRVSYLERSAYLFWRAAMLGLRTPQG
jgi:hypothetical protein